MIQESYNRPSHYVEQPEKPLDSNYVNLEKIKNISRTTRDVSVSVVPLQSTETQTSRSLESHSDDDTCSPKPGKYSLYLY